jgi:hypothetical protein
MLMGVCGSLRRVWVCGVGVLAGVLGVWCVVGSAPALAALRYPFVGQLTGVGQASDVAVDDVSGDALVPNGGVVHVFGASGSLVATWDGSNTPAGSFGGSVVVAVSEMSGRVYAADPGHGVVDVFESSGSYVCQVTGAGSASVSASECDKSAPGAPGGSFAAGSTQTVAVDQASGEVFVYDQGHDVIDRFSAAGVYLSQVTGAGAPNGSFSGGVLGLAVDDVSGYLLVVDVEPSAARVVYVFEAASGVYLARWDGSAASNPPGVPGGSPNFLRVAADNATGDVYVTAPGAVDQFSPWGEYLGQFTKLPNGTALSHPEGVAVDPGTSRLYFTDTTQEVVDIFSLVPVVVPDVSTGGTSSVRGLSVVAEGVVNPDGIPVSDCRFEYGTSTGYGRSAPCAGSVGSGSSGVAVHAELTGLSPETAYHYRLSASNANGTNQGADAEVTTAPVSAPVVDSVSTSSLTGTSVVLDAAIDPKGFDTRYRFELGTSTAYGESVPMPDGDAGAGVGDVAVSQRVGGLTAGVTYHFRVVAQSAYGTVASADNTFVFLTASGGLPDNRAYEMVSPSSKNGALLNNDFHIAAFASEDGSRVIATSRQAFAGAGSSTGNRLVSLSEPYVFTRTSSGWVTTPLAPPASQLENNSLWEMNADPGSTLYRGQTVSGGREDWYVNRAGGPLVDVGKPVFWTSDFSHFVYEDSSGQPVAYPGAAPAGAAGAQPSPVGVSGGAGSADLLSICPLEPEGYAGPYVVRISADGSRLIFTAGPCSSGSGANAGVAIPARELYERIEGSRTVQLSLRSPGDCASSACQTSSPSNVSLIKSSNDGSRVFFETAQQLTDQATQGSNNIYEYDFDAPAGANLTTVSAGDTSGLGPGLQGVMAVSPDGSHLYFVARGVLSAGANARGQSALAGADNLYVYERDAAYPNGRTAFIATPPESDAEEWNVARGGIVSMRANVTPDGRFLVFLSHGDLTADDTSVTGAEQVFRYDALTGQMVRISIGERGFNDNGNAGKGDVGFGWPAVYIAIPPQGLQEVEGATPRWDPTMSHDGSYVFFISPVALTPGALNEVRIGGQGHYAGNLYEWHEGHVYLISDGRDVATETIAESSTVRLIGTDASGANVFFQTADALVPQDTNGSSDIYDARICTVSDPCISAPAAGAACQGEACSGVPGSQPAAVAPASESFAGAGNIAAGVHKAKPKKRKQHRRRKRRVKRRARSGKAGRSTRGRR